MFASSSGATRRVPLRTKSVKKGSENFTSRMVRPVSSTHKIYYSPVLCRYADLMSYTTVISLGTSGLLNRHYEYQQGLHSKSRR